MPVNKSIKKAVREKSSLESRHTLVARKPAKANGTRAGVLEDWREGSAKSGRMAGKLGKSIRDGR